MTTVVTISAHCGDTKEVRVTITGSQSEEFALQDGEKTERYAYDDRVITVQEVVKVDRRALEIEAAEFSLRQAELRFQDAASRGFHLGNQSALKIDVEVKQAELDALRQPADMPAYEDDDLTAAAPPGVVSDPGRPVPWHRSGGGQRAGEYHADMNLPEPVFSTTIAAAEIKSALTPEARTFLDSLDPAPFAEPTGDADPSLAPTEPYPEPT